jgi:small GTP-binding protein
MITSYGQSTTTRKGTILLLRILVGSGLVASLQAFSVVNWRQQHQQLHPTRQKSGSTTHLPTKLYAHADNDDITNNNNNEDLYKLLDANFNYTGRMSTSQSNFRCGFVGIVGAPNMGKSTLANALLKETLCATTSRPQTTRHAILGLLSGETYQLCLVDTPGVINAPAYSLQESMMEAVRGTVQQANAILVVTDPFYMPLADDIVFESLVRSHKPIVVAINKVDLLKSASRKQAVPLQQSLQPNTTNTITQTTTQQQQTTQHHAIEQVVQRWRQLLPRALAILPVQASNGEHDAGVAALRCILVGDTDNLSASIRALGRPISGMFCSSTESLEQASRALLPKSPPLYDCDILTDRPERFICSEMVRAALFESSLTKELPYCCEVTVESFQDGSNLLKLEATVIVERDSQKGIVVGKGGAQIKAIGIVARKKLEAFFQKQVRALSVGPLSLFGSVCG